MEAGTRGVMMGVVDAMMWNDEKGGIGGWGMGCKIGGWCHENGGSGSGKWGCG